MHAILRISDMQHLENNVNAHRSQINALSGIFNFRMMYFIAIA